MLTYPRRMKLSPFTRRRSLLLFVFSLSLRILMCMSFSIKDTLESSLETTNHMKHLWMFFLTMSVTAVAAALASPKNHRRDLLQSLLSVSASSSLILTARPNAGVASETTTPVPMAVASETTSFDSIRIPLRYVPSLSAYVVQYSVGGERFLAIADTGSPFLSIPGYCNRQRWGCYRPEDSRPSGLEPTYERFDNNQGWVEWRKAPFSFVDAQGSLMGASLFTFGVLSESLMDGPGGVFFGLIRDTDAWIRPSFLGQTETRSFQIDLAAPDDQKFLTLSNGEGALLLEQGTTAQRDYIPLVRDLTRRFKDPAYHYTAQAVALRANGSRILANSRAPIFVIFDTGVSGMVVTSDIFEDRYTTARRNREKNLWGQVEIDLCTKSGEIVTLAATKPVTTPLGERPWPNFKNAHLIVMGLAFLDGHKMTVDIDQQRLWFE